MDPGAALISWWFPAPLRRGITSAVQAGALNPDSTPDWTAVHPVQRSGAASQSLRAGPRRHLQGKLPLSGSLDVQGNLGSAQVGERVRRWKRIGNDGASKGSTLPGVYESKPTPYLRPGGVRRGPDRPCDPANVKHAYQQRGPSGRTQMRLEKLTYGS